MIVKKDWIYFSWKNYIRINIVNSKKTMNKLKGIFRPLKCYFRFGKTWYPILYCSKPAFFHIKTSDVQWKDKYDTPRYEGPPFVWIHLYKWNLIWYWDLPLHNFIKTEEYWEQALWYLYYYNTISYGELSKPNIKAAKESWPWQDGITKESSWTDEFLIK